MGDAAGLASLDRACVHIICANLEARDAARLQCVCRALRTTAGEAALWRLLCARDWELLELQAPALDCNAGQAHSSWAEAYRAWHAAFGAYGSARYRIAKRAVAGVKAWAAANAPAVAASLQPGATEADVDAVAAALELPALAPARGDAAGVAAALARGADVDGPAPALRLVWRLLAGQQLRYDDTGGAQFHESALHGVLGSYAVYDHCVSTRLLNLGAVVRHTRACRAAGFIAANSPLLLIAASFDLGKLVFVDALTADVHVALRSRQLHPACPPGGGDGVLRWLERYASDLGAQRYAADEVEPGAPQTRGICLFPRLPPLLSVAVTNGVRVEASAVWMPEVSTETRDAFVYRVSFSLLSLEEQSAAGMPPVESVQLLGRHWVIEDAHDGREEVRGAGVIGEHPRLLPGAPPFRYQSQTPMRRSPAARGGRMWGAFTFVHGTIVSRTGPEFEAACAAFPLAVPEYAY